MSPRQRSRVAMSVLPHAHAAVTAAAPSQGTTAAPPHHLRFDLTVALLSLLAMLAWEASAAGSGVGARLWHPWWVSMARRVDHAVAAARRRPRRGLVRDGAAGWPRAVAGGPCAAARRALVLDRRVPGVPVDRADAQAALCEQLPVGPGRIRRRCGLRAALAARRARRWARTLFSVGPRGGGIRIPQRVLRLAIDHDRGWRACASP